MGKHIETVIAVIPARWGSTRFPGKPLAEIAGEPMIVHVVRRAAAADSVSEVVVATDDARVADAVRGIGVQAVMTGDCASGTDRIAEAVLSRPGWSLAVNVQGDEPLLSGRNIDTLVAGMSGRPEIGIGTLCRPLASKGCADANAVKVVRRRDGRALYFSRAPIPYHRNSGGAAAAYRLHLGIYCFRRDALASFVALDPSPLERLEGLEQLRALENGLDILVLDAPDEAIGVDTREDLAEVEKIMNRQSRRGAD